MPKSIKASSFPRSLGSVQSFCWRRRRSHRLRRAPFHTTLNPALLAATTLAGRSVTGALLADRPNPRSVGLLLCLDESQHVAEALVLCNRRMGDALLGRVEDPTGQGQSFPADLERPDRPGTGLDIATDRAACMRAVIENELPPLVMHDEACTDLPLIANPKNLGHA